MERNRLLFCNRGNIDKKQRDLYGRIVDVLGEHYPDNEDWFFRFGYECNGPLYYGFCKWLSNKLKEKKYSKVFFLARDGYLIKSAYDLISSESDYECEYLYISRRAIHFPLLWLFPDVKCFLSLNSSKRWTYETLCNRLGLNKDDWIDYWQECGLSKEYSFSVNDVVQESKINTFLERTGHVADEESKSEFDLLLDYLVQEGMEGRIAIVDSGGFGTIHRCLLELIKRNYLNAEIDGYYMWSNDMNGLDYSCYGYDGKSIGESHVLIEFPMTSFEGTTRSYKEKNARIVPCLDDFEYEKHEWVKNIVLQIQSGTLYGVRVLSNSFNDYQFSAQIACHNINSSMWNPRTIETEMFGDIFFHSDCEDAFLAKPKELFYYICHPIRFLYDYKNAKWRIGYLKRIFKIPAPYYGFVRFTRVMFHLIRAK